MMIDPVSGTAQWTAAMREEESARPDHLFDDPFAAVLAGEQGRALLEQDGTAPAVPIRTRYFDELIARNAPAQVVLVAAGMDTRAYRLGLPSTTAVYELDRPELLRLKDSLLDSVAAKPTCIRCPVGTDLAGEWGSSLIDAGFDPRSPTMWSVEGLTYYLDEASVTGLIAQITELSAPGSDLLIDFFNRSLLESPARREWLNRLAERGSPWRFGIDEPEKLLEPFWSPEVNTLSSVGKALDRWTGEDVSRDTPGAAQVFLTHARTAGDH